MNKINTEQPQSETLSSTFNRIIEKIVLQKGWAELYQKVKSTQKLSPIVIFKMLYKSNGNEEKLQEKIMRKQAKLQKKLKKYNLEQQFNELANTVQICNPKLAFCILKRTGGDINLAAQKIQRFSQMGSHKQEMIQMFKINNPNYETIIEDLLLNGYIFPVPFFFRLMYKFQGDVNKIKEYLGSFERNGEKKAFRHLFKGGCMMKQFKNHCGAQKDRSRSCKSPSSSSDDSDIDDKKIQEYSQANIYLIQNGFKDAKENLRVLSLFKCDKEAALRFLIKSVLKQKCMSEKKKCNSKKHHRINEQSTSCHRSSSRNCSKFSSSDSNNSKSKSRSKSNSKSHSGHRKHHNHHHHHPHQRNEFPHFPHHRPFFMHHPHQDQNFMPSPPSNFPQFGRFQQIGQLFQDCFNQMNTFRNCNQRQQQNEQTQQQQPQQNIPKCEKELRQNMRHTKHSHFQNKCGFNPIYERQQNRCHQKKEDNKKSNQPQSNDSSYSDIEILTEDSNKQ